MSLAPGGRDEMQVIWHLLPRRDWEALPRGAPITNDSLAAEGFIHCTDDAGVLLRVANAFYVDQPGDMVALEIDVGRLSSPCVWEPPAHPAPTNERLAPTFPHVYGSIDASAVLSLRSIRRDPAGQFVGYGEPEG